MSYSQLQEALRDVAFTTATPFTLDGEAIRHEALRENLQWMYEHGARLFIPCGNTGEYYSLSDDERVAVVETHATAFGDGATNVAGVSGSLKAATRLVQRYEDAGADAMMVMQPHHTYQHERGLVDYYRRVADSTDRGIVLYKTDSELTREMIADLSSIENVVGVKYAINDVKEFGKSVSELPSLVWINGVAERYAPSFALEGAGGFTTGIGNFVPEATLALRDALDAGDWDRALSIRNLLRPYEDLREESGAGNTLRAANNVPAVKFGLDHIGLNGGPVRLPLVNLSEADRVRAKQCYDAFKRAELATPTST